MIETQTPVPAAPVETRPKTPQEVGEHAARYIEEHGWWQSSVGAEGPKVACAANAILHVGEPSLGLGYLAVQDKLAEIIGGRSLGDIWAWNDAPERTLPEVLAALRSIR